MARGRSLSTTHTLLLLDGQEAGFLNSFEGGTAKAEVVKQQTGSSFYVKKSLGSLTYEPLIMSFGIGKEMLDWIQSSFAGDYKHKSGAIVAADFDYKAQRRLEFHNATINSVTIPALDASSKDAAYFTVTVQPEYTENSPGDGNKIKVPIGKKTKNWLASNFRFKLGDLPCDRVSRIESLTVQFIEADIDVGFHRDYIHQPTNLNFPDLSITFSAADAAPWEAWFKSFVIEGKNSDSDELSGSITFLAPDLKSELGRIDLHNVGIFALKQASTNKDEIARYKAELYCEYMTFEIKAT